MRSPKPPSSKPVVRKRRCAVYTRKSSEEGLEQEFNSLDALPLADQPGAGDRAIVDPLPPDLDLAAVELLAKPSRRAMVSGFNPP